MNEFDYEQEQSRAEVASYLRQFADGLESDGKVTLVFGEQSVAMNPPNTMHFRINADSDSSWLSSENGRSLHIELGWEQSEVDHGDDELTIVQQPSRSQQAGTSEAHTHETTDGQRTGDDTRPTDR